MENGTVSSSIVELSFDEVTHVEGGVWLQAARLAYATVKMGVEPVYNLAKKAGEEMTRTTD